MTQIKCKSFKASHAQELDQYINKFLAEEKVTDIVHVSSSGVQSTTLMAVTLFYKCEDTKVEKKVTKKKAAKKPVEVENAEPKTDEKEVSNG